MMRNINAFRILVVEDNPGDFILVKEYLSQQILPVIVHAENFTEASSVLQSDDAGFDVILLDLTLPDKSGADLINEILKIASASPVIILTGYNDFDFGVQSISLGVSDYLFKNDLNAKLLYKSISYCIERKKQLTRLKESEARYSNLFHLSPQPMWVYDPDTFQFLQVNKAASDHYGYSPQEFLTMTILDIMPPEDAVKIREQRNTNISENVFNRQFRHYKKNREVAEVEIYSNPIIIDNKVCRSVIAIDVTDKILFEQKLTRAIIKTQEDERYEIGGELHDNVCQILATSQINLSMLKRALNPSAMQWFDQCREYIIMATDEIRNLSHRLAPAVFQDTTLEQDIKKLLDTFNIEDKYKVTLLFDEHFKMSGLDRDLQLSLYRILQEHLRNIIKYSKATSIRVEVTMKDEIVKMQVSDNGVGFDVNSVKSGIGLSNMRRRAELFKGTLKIISSPGNGCEVEIEIPFHKTIPLNGVAGSKNLTKAHSKSIK